MPEHDELPRAIELPGAGELDAIDDHHDRRDAWGAVIITAIALGVMLVSSLLIVLSTAKG